jgi:hypothetical protein
LGWWGGGRALRVVLFDRDRGLFFFSGVHGVDEHGAVGVVARRCARRRPARLHRPALSVGTRRPCSAARGAQVRAHAAEPASVVAAASAAGRCLPGDVHDAPMPRQRARELGSGPQPPPRRRVTRAADTAARLAIRTSKARRRRCNGGKASSGHRESTSYATPLAHALLVRSAPPRPVAGPEAGLLSRPRLSHRAASTSAQARLGVSECGKSCRSIHFFSEKENWKI